MENPSVEKSSSPARSCSIGIRFWLVKVTNVSLAKQALDADDADADADEDPESSMYWIDNMKTGYYKSMYKTHLLVG
jgi:hypothetical protein